jgi:hypothetical protein
MEEWKRRHTVNGIGMDELRFGGEDELGRAKIVGESYFVDGLKVGVGIKPVDMEPDAVCGVSGDA